jgi:hypothetical protein
MKINEILTEGMVFARGGAGGPGGAGKVKMKWRCETGARAGRIVSSPQQCGAAIDTKKRAAMKTTRARTKVRQARRSKRTKKLNVASKIMQALNKFKRRGGPKKAQKRKPSKPFAKTKFISRIKSKKSKK